MKKIWIQEKEIDKQGRILLPRKYLDKLGVSERTPVNVIMTDEEKIIIEKAESKE